VLKDFTKSATLAFKGEGEVILLVGETVGWLGQSLYLRDVCGREEGAPPPVDLIEEKENGDFVRALIADGLVSAVHDIADGGLAVGLAEMAMAGNIGAKLDAAPSDTPAHAFWFGEDQARYILTAKPADAVKILARARDASVMISRLGATDGDALVIAGERPLSVQVLSERHEGWLPNYMGSAAA
jgi:phosphoribosylformylglycinamidine synthase